MFSNRWIVALPAKNEADRLPGALLALDKAARLSNSNVHVFVLANNSSDDTYAVAGAAASKAQNAKIHVSRVHLPHALAHAGGARREAVWSALRHFGAGLSDGIFSTDADARVAPNIFSKMGAAFRHRAEVVLCKIECTPDPFEPAPDMAVRMVLKTATWRHRVRQLVETVRHGRIPHPPLHDDYGGAGIAALVDTYCRLGGFPAIPSDEDREFVLTADKAKVRVSRQSGAIVDVYTRLRGRAHGGMATELTRFSRSEGRSACLVEHHELTTRRILRTRCHARAFSSTVTEWEAVDAAIAGLDNAILAHGDGLHAELGR